MKTNRTPHDINWELNYLIRTLDRVAHGNISQIPIAIALEDGKWSVDIQVHVPRVTEYEIAVWDRDLAFALAKANDQLLNYQSHQYHAKKNNALFGIEI